MPIIPATQEAEAGESLEPGDGDCSEPRSCHCTPASVQSETLCQNKTKQKMNHTDHILRPQWNKNRNQYQEDLPKPHNYIEINLLLDNLSKE